MEQVGALVGPRGSITTRAISWAITSLRTQHATIAGLARQLGVSWWTLWRAIKPELERLAADPKRFVGVSSLGVDEHIVRHEALLFRMEVRDHHCPVVVAAG